MQDESLTSRIQKATLLNSRMEEATLLNSREASVLNLQEATVFNLQEATLFNSRIQEATSLTSLILELKFRILLGDLRAYLYEFLVFIAKKPNFYSKPY